MKLFKIASSKPQQDEKLAEENKRLKKNVRRNEKSERRS